MKKLILILNLLIISIVSLSQNNLPEGLTITKSGDNYEFNFTLPSYLFDTINVIKPDGTTEDFFNIIVNDDFGIIDSVGLPQLPHLTFMFAIPYSSSIPNIYIQNISSSEIDLTDRILPFQIPWATDTTEPPFTINENYYSSTGINFNAIQITDEFIVSGVKGIRISIMPFVYNPLANKLTVRSNIQFEIQLDTILTTKVAHSTVMESYLSSLFVNDLSLSKSIEKGNYLIITPPEYENILTYFANYKRNIGYNVTIANTNLTGTSKEDIKSYIQGLYDNLSTRPVFVLLIGDVDKIPCWIGDHNSEPRTDLNYVLLEGNNKVADAFIGRFSVNSSNAINQLQNIINKTIFMETNLHNLNKKAVFLADDDNHSYTEAGHDNVINNAFEPNGYTCLKLYENDGATSSDALNALNDDQIFLIYSGHGSSNADRLSGPLVLSTDIGSLSNTVYPFGFSFACWTNKFQKAECFGEAWIRRKHGGVAYYGASHTTFYHVDKPFEKKLFNNAWYDENKEQLGPMIFLGMEKLCNNLWSSQNRRKYREMFNLMGDPSLITTGIGCLTDYIFANNEVFHLGDVITYHAANNITNNADFVVESGADVTLKAGNSIVLKPGFHAKEGSNFHAYIEPCNSSKSTKSLNSNEIANTENKDNIKTVSENTYENKVNAYPNPFISQTTLEYTLQETGDVNIEVYNLLGEQMLMKNINGKEKGSHTYSISGVNFQNGIYIIKVQTKEYKEVLFIYKQDN